MSLEKINNMLRDKMKRIIIESEISEPSHIARMVIGDVSHQTGSLVYDVKDIKGGATGRFGISEVGNDSKHRRKGVSLRVSIGEDDINVSIMDSLGNTLNALSGLRDMEDYSSLISSISKSIQGYGISK